ncbi:hypothetical protein [Pseudonocardia acaciae]|uniref:hypothetical protein n=1 Tax=Pseudonocardia acaciae TaxID=551276 RepID=UPI000684A540|nr:hypothetical protein [Pseudonocardia acaciae]
MTPASGRAGLSDPPTLRLLSLGAGVQSTTLALLAVEGALPAPDLAIFADTMSEPRKVYAHLDRLVAVLTDVGIEVVRVSQGDLGADTLSTAGFMRLPAFVQGAGNGAAMLRRQCTERYKLEPIRREIRRRLGARTSATGAVLTPPPGAVAEQWIGFSTDEIGRVKDQRVPYIRNRYPLLELNMSRQNCLAWLRRRGWGDTPKSACTFCPFHGNRQWREMRDHDPAAWADAVEFDRRIRQRTFRGPQEVPFLHRSLLPLDQAPIDQVQRKELRDQQGDLFDLVEHGDPDGCSPYGCRSGGEAA